MEAKANQENNKKRKFKQMTGEWLEFRTPKIKEQTLLNYKYIIETRLDARLGDLTLEELENYDFNNYAEELMESLSGKSVRDILTILKQILKYIEIKYNMDFKLDSISFPRFSKKEIEVLNKYERKKLERYCLKSEDPKTLGFLISIYAGLRIGEVCALKWEDIDIENRIINVNHTLQRVYMRGTKSKIIITPPKTPNSIRQIPIGKKLYEKLKMMSENVSSDAYVLTGEAEKFVEPIGYRYTYRNALEKLKIDFKKYNCLRHTFAIRCVEVGMDVKSLSEILGHNNIKDTLEAYINSSFEAKKKYMERL